MQIQNFWPPRDIMHLYEKYNNITLSIISKNTKGKHSLNSLTKKKTTLRSFEFLQRPIILRIAEKKILFYQCYLYGLIRPLLSRQNAETLPPWWCNERSSEFPLGWTRHSWHIRDHLRLVWKTATEFRCHISIPVIQMWILVP